MTDLVPHVPAADRVIDGEFVEQFPPVSPVWHIVATVVFQLVLVAAAVGWVVAR